jgi:flagellar biosynthesis protein FlhF
MNVRKFIAATARDALRKVKETLGPDAIILSNRGIPGGVEIMAVAARDMEMIVPTPSANPAAARSRESAASPSVARRRYEPPAPARAAGARRRSPPLDRRTARFTAAAWQHALRRRRAAATPAGALHRRRRTWFPRQ